MTHGVRVLCLWTATSLLAPALGWAHQTGADNGATVTVHVNPDEESIAGQPATVAITKVKVRRGARFRWRTCGCRLTVTNADAEVIEQRDVGRRTTVVVMIFPAEGVP